MPSEENLMMLEQQTLGEIAVALPGATALFREAGLDYCCGGQDRLSDAVAAQSLDLDTIIADLRALKQNGAATTGAIASPAERDSAALIDAIITRFHRVHSQEIPELIQLAEKVETVHQRHTAVPAGLAGLLKTMLGELTIHMQKEELVLFPQMKNGARMPLQPPIAAMMADHQEHGAQLEYIKLLTGRLQVPDDGCATWRALYSGLAKFMDDLTEHIHIENNILFPRFL